METKILLFIKKYYILSLTIFNEIIWVLEIRSEKGNTKYDPEY